MLSLPRSRFPAGGSVREEYSVYFRLSGARIRSMSEPWLSVVGGGFVAAVLTLLFNALWDSRKQKMAEDWEFKRYQANQIHFSTAGVMEAYFSAKTEMFYITSTLESLLAALNQLAAQADQIVRQQGGPELTVAILEQRKQALLQPFQKFNQEHVNLRSR